MSCICFRNKTILGNIDAVLLEQHPLYQGSRALARYATGPIILCGLVGNILSCAVALRSHNRHRPFGIYMMVLAIVDTATLCLGQMQGWIMYHFIPERMSPFQCGELLFMAVCTGNIGSYVIVMISHERYNCVCKTSTYNRERTVKKAYRILTLISIFCILKNLHYFFTTKCSFCPESKVLFCGVFLFSNEMANTGLALVELLINSIIPFALIITFNILIIRGLHRYKRLVTKRMSTSSQCQAMSAGIRSDADNRTGVTLMLVVVSFVFVGLSAPIFVFRFLYSFVRSSLSIDGLALYVLFDIVFGLLYAINSSINFYLYCLTGKAFRRDLVMMFNGLRNNLMKSRRDSNNAASQEHILQLHFTAYKRYWVTESVIKTPFIFKYFSWKQEQSMYLFTNIFCRHLHCDFYLDSYCLPYCKRHFHAHFREWQCLLFEFQECLL